MFDIASMTDSELREFARRLYTSHMERVLIAACQDELKKRGLTW